MHLTLKQEGIVLDCTLEEQQIKLSEFVEYYNFIRPHESLGQKRPGDVYQRSCRIWNGQLKTPEYPKEYKIEKSYYF